MTNYAEVEIYVGINLNPKDVVLCEFPIAVCPVDRFKNPYLAALLLERLCKRINAVLLQDENDEVFVIAKTFSILSWLPDINWRSLPEQIAKEVEDELRANEGLLLQQIATEENKPIDELIDQLLNKIGGTL